MARKDPQQTTEYMRLYKIRKRDAFFEGKTCTVCGSAKRLELDHIDPMTKDPKFNKDGNGFWCWSKERREAELAKCQVLCHECHARKTRENHEHVHGETHGSARLTVLDVIEIRERYRRGEKQCNLANEYSISPSHIGNIIHHRKWKYLEGEAGVL